MGRRAPDVQRPGSFLVARTAKHKAFLRAELAQSRQWGLDVREAGIAELAERTTYYQPSGTELAVWCPEDIYVDEPARPHAGLPFRVPTARSGDPRIGARDSCPNPQFPLISL